MNNFTYYINSEEVTRSTAYRALLVCCDDEESTDDYWIGRRSEDSYSLIY
jgi:hypothetical protein